MSAPAPRSPRPDWAYDDLKQVGVDFANVTEVDAYDARQGDQSAEDARILADLRVGRGDLVADIGCGTGALACAAAKRGAVVHAIDASEAMLAAARKRAAAGNLKTISFHCASFLSFAVGAPFDLIVTKYALHHVPDFWKGVAMARMHAALRPGGRLYIEDVVFSCAPAAVAQTVDAWIVWMIANAGYDRDTVARHVREEHSTFGWIMEGLIERAGFRLLSRRYDAPVYATYLAARV